MFGLWQEVVRVKWVDRNEVVFVYLSSGEYGAVAGRKGESDYKLSPWDSEDGSWDSEDTIKQVGPQALGEWND